MIDMGRVWENLFFDNISHITFGTNVVANGMEVEIDVRAKDGTFERKTLPIQHAIDEISAALMDESVFKWLNPLYQSARSLTGIRNFTKY